MMSVKSKQKITTMKNIHVLPTEKQSRLYSWEDKLVLSKLATNPFNKNIYITSDETAYPYALHLKNQEVLKIKGVGENSGELYHDKGFSYPDECQKIILTDNKDLIKDGVQSIYDEFLEWFVKNPSCESVKTEIVEYGFDEVPICIYKIIIPKEEPKQSTKYRILSETSEETKHKAIYYANSLITKLNMTSNRIKEIQSETAYPESRSVNQALLKVWNECEQKHKKERMYSEEDLKEAFIEGYKQRAEKSDLIFDNASRMYAIHLFEQYKNK